MQRTKNGSQPTVVAHAKRAQQATGQPKQKGKSSAIHHYPSSSQESVLHIQKQDSNLPFHSLEVILKLKGNESVTSAPTASGDSLRNQVFSINKNTVTIQNSSAEGNGQVQEFEAVYLETATPYTLYASSLQEQVRKLLKDQSLHEVNVVVSDPQNHFLFGGKQSLGQVRAQQLAHSLGSASSKNIAQATKEGIFNLLLTDLLQNCHVEQLSAQVTSIDSNQQLFDNLAIRDSVVLVGQLFLNCTSYQIQKNEDIQRLEAYLGRLSRSDPLVVSVTFCAKDMPRKTIRLVTSDTPTLIQQLDHFQQNYEKNQLSLQPQHHPRLLNLLKYSLVGCSKLLVVACCNQYDAQSSNQVLALARQLTSIKSQQKKLSKTQAPQNNEGIYKGLPSWLLQPNYVKKLPSLNSKGGSCTNLPVQVSAVQVVSKKKLQQKNSLKTNVTKESSNQAKPALLEKQSPTQSPRTNIARKFIANNKRMTTINESTRDDVVSKANRLSDLSNSVSITTTPDINQSNIDYNKDEIELQFKKQLELQLLQSTEQEILLAQSQKYVNQAIKRVKDEVAFLWRKKPAYNQKQNPIDSLKKQLAEREAQKRTIDEQMAQLLDTKKGLLAHINQLAKGTKESEKDRKLREMEDKIREMTKKLEEKEKLIEQTVRSQKIKHHFQPHRVEPFSPKLGSRKQDFKTKGNRFTRPSKGSVSSSLQALTDSNSHSLVNGSSHTDSAKHSLLRGLESECKYSLVNQSQPHVDSRKGLDKRKHNSTANLIKRTKPTVMINIAGEEKESSHNSSLAPIINSVTSNSMVFQQLSSTKLSQPNKLSMLVPSSTNVNPVKNNKILETLENESNKKSSKASKSGILSKKQSSKLQSDSARIGKENVLKKMPLKDHMPAEDIDEGVQSVKRSVVPVRSISNLLGQGNTSAASVNNSIKKPGNLSQVASEKNYFIMHSPPDTNRKLQGISSDQKTSLVKDHNSSVFQSASLLRETSLKQFHQRKAQISAQKQSQGQLTKVEKGQGDQDEVKDTQTAQKDSPFLDMSDCGTSQFIVQEDANQEDLSNKSCNEGLQNTPPRIQKKISELASKNKFQIQNEKPKVSANISIRGTHLITSNNSVGSKYQTESKEDLKQKVLLGSADKQRDLGGYSMQGLEQRKKEKVDNFLRKSSELMSALRNSADQAALLQPINRAAARLRSIERSGMMTVKNEGSSLQESFSHKPSNDPTQGILSSKTPQQTFGLGLSKDNMFMAGQSKTMDNRGDMTSRSKVMFERKITDLKEARLRNRSSQSNQRQGFNTSTGLVVCIDNGNEHGQGAVEQTQHHSLAADLRRNRSGILQSQDLEEKINELDSMFKTQSLSNLKINSATNAQLTHRSSLKEQILAKCMKNNNQKKQNEGQQMEQMLKSKWMNAHLLKCRSNDNLNMSVPTHQNICQKPEIQRARSITINDQQNPQAQYESGRFNCTLSLSAANKLPKWGELAQIIKRNLYTSSNQSPQFQPIDERSEQDQKENKPDMVKPNQKDICGASPSSQAPQYNSCKPPTNPQANFKKRKNFEGENLKSDGQQQVQNTLPRGRSESHYLPTMSNGLNLRTPRGHNPSQMGIKSPNTNLSVLRQKTQSNDNSYYQHITSYYDSNTTNYGHQSVTQSQQLVPGSMKSCLMLQPPNASGTGNKHQRKPSGNEINQTAQRSPFSSSAEYGQGMFTGIISPLFVEPIGNRDKARPEVTELIKKQRSRLNSQNKREHQYGANENTYFQKEQPYLQTLRANGVNRYP